MEQYPDNITVTWKTSSQDGNLDWVESSTTTTFTGKCRAELNGSGRTIAGADGTFVTYGYTVYLPLTSTVIPLNANFSLTLSDGRIITGFVKGSSNLALNSKIWV